MPIFMSLNSHRNLYPIHCSFSINSVNVSVIFPYAQKIQCLISILTFFQFFHILKHRTNKTITANTKVSELLWQFDIKLLGLYVSTHLFSQLLQKKHQSSYSTCRPCSVSIKIITYSSYSHPRGRRNKQKH
jgi:hypothetical protein